MRRANGEGTYIVRKDGRIEYRVNVGLSADGERLRKSFYGTSKPNARAKYTKWLKSNPVALEKVKTLGEYAENWLPIYKKGKVSDGTYYEYDLIVKMIIAQLGKIKFPELRRSHIEKLMRSVSGFSISRQKKVCFLIKAIIASAVEDRFCAENVAASVEPPKAVKKEVDIFSSDDIKKLLALDHPFAPVVRTLFYTGMRRGELIGLSWRNVDLKNKVIHVTRALSDGEIKEQTKGKCDRVIPISPDLAAVLKAVPRIGLTVFCMDNGQPMTKDYYNYWFKRFVQLAGVEYKSGHKCRHSFVSYALSSGMNVRFVQQIAGHADLEQTENYAHVIPKDFKMKKLKF